MIVAYAFTIYDCCLRRMEVMARYINLKMSIRKRVGCVCGNSASLPRFVGTCHPNGLSINKYINKGLSRKLLFHSLDCFALLCFASCLATPRNASQRLAMTDNRLICNPLRNISHNTPAYGYPSLRVIVLVSKSTNAMTLSCRDLSSLRRKRARRAPSSLRGAQRLRGTKQSNPESMGTVIRHCKALRGTKQGKAKQSRKPVNVFPQMRSSASCQFFF